MEELKRVLRKLSGSALLLLASCAAPKGTVDPNAGEVFVARTFIQADYDRVWDHLTRAELYEGWWPCPALAFGDTKGAELLWGTPECTVYEGTLHRMEKGEGLAFSLRFVGFDFDEDPTPVAIYARERGPSVLVEIFHDSREAPRSSAIIGRVGWPKLLARLKTLVETGEPMVWPDPEP